MKSFTFQVFQVCCVNACMKNVYFIQNDQKITIYIYLRDIMQQWYYTQGEIDILVQPSTQQQRCIKDNIGWRSKTTEKSDVKQKKEKIQKEILKNQVISSIPKLFDNNEFDTISMVSSWEKKLYIELRKMRGKGGKKRRNKITCKTKRAKKIFFDYLKIKSSRLWLSSTNNFQCNSEWKTQDRYHFHFHWC